MIIYIFTMLNKQADILRSQLSKYIYNNRCLSGEKNLSHIVSPKYSHKQIKGLQKYQYVSLRKSKRQRSDLLQLNKKSLRGDITHTSISSNKSLDNREKNSKIDRQIKVINPFNHHCYAQGQTILIQERKGQEQVRNSRKDKIKKILNLTNSKYKTQESHKNSRYRYFNNHRRQQKFGENHYYNKFHNLDTYIEHLNNKNMQQDDDKLKNRNKQGNKSLNFQKTKSVLHRSNKVKKKEGLEPIKTQVQFRISKPKVLDAEVTQIDKQADDDSKIFRKRSYIGSKHKKNVCNNIELNTSLEISVSPRQKPIHQSPQNLKHRFLKHVIRVGKNLSSPRTSEQKINLGKNMGWNKRYFKEEKDGEKGWNLKRWGTDDCEQILYC